MTGRYPGLRAMGAAVVTFVLAAGALAALFALGAVLASVVPS